MSFLQVTYDIGLDDIHALTMHRLHTSPYFRRRMWRTHGVGLMAGVVIACLGTRSQNPAVWVVGGVMFAAIYTCLLWYSFHGGLRRQSERLFAEGKNLALMGSQVLTLHEAYLESTSPMFAIQMRWDVVERLAHTPTHIFFYISSMQAVVVPTKAFSNPEAAEEFYQAAERLRTNAHAQPLDFSTPFPWSDRDQD